MQTDKKAFQTCEWSVRPLTKGMLRYAQSDTHYLLYVADRLREQLIEMGELCTDQSITKLPNNGPKVCVNLALQLKHI